jgi:hypothetical protein
VVKPLVLAAILAAASTARADSPPDSDTTQRLSVAGSLIPVALLGIGTLVAGTGSNNAIRDFGGVTAISGVLLGIITPSLGHFHNGDYLDPAIALRAGGVFVELIGLVKATNNEVGDCQSRDPSCHIQASTYVLLGSGIAMYLGGMAFDVVWKPHRDGLQIAPTALRTPTSMVPGVAAGFRF